MSKTLIEATHALLDSPEFSERYLTREDRKDIHAEVEKICKEVADRIIVHLKNKGYLKKIASNEEFTQLLKETLKDYLEEHKKKNV